jgi:hypothetical protein
MKLQDKLSQFGTLDYENLQKQAETSILMQNIIQHVAVLLCHEAVFSGDPRHWRDCLQVT